MNATNIWGLVGFAKVTVAAEPAETFEVINGVKMTAELEALRFPEWAIYGVLDVRWMGCQPLVG